MKMTLKLKMNSKMKTTSKNEDDIVKLTSMQLVGESIAAISVPLEAILKLENVDYCGKRLSESAVILI